MCSAAALLYGTPGSVVRIEPFRGREDYARSRGAAVELVDDPECARLMTEFIARRHGGG
jgi:cytosine deaminase